MTISEKERDALIELACKTAYIVKFHNYDFVCTRFYVDYNGFIIEADCDGRKYIGKRIDTDLLLRAHGVVFMVGNNGDIIYKPQKFKYRPSSIEIITQSTTLAGNLIKELECVNKSLKITRPTKNKQ